MANGIKDRIGIYAVYNKVTGECVYVGSGGIRNRKSSHLGELRHGKHKNKGFQKEFDEFGEGIFEFEILDYCSKEKKTDLETKYTKELKPKFAQEDPKPCPRYHDEYPLMSLAQRGEKNPNAKLTEDEVKEILWLKANTNMSQKTIADAYEISRGYVSAIGNQKWLHINGMKKPIWYGNKENKEKVFKVAATTLNTRKMVVNIHSKDIVSDREVEINIQ